MIKLSELENNAKVIDENTTIYSTEEVRSDLLYFKANKFYTTTESYAAIDAYDMLGAAIENEYENMYEDWDERILEDVTEEDIEKMQAILDDILSRNKEQNIVYYQDEEIDIFN